MMKFAWTATFRWQYFKRQGAQRHLILGTPSQQYVHQLQFFLDTQIIYLNCYAISNSIKVAKSAVTGLIDSFEDINCKHF